LIDSSVINSTIAKKLLPDFSLVAIDSLTVPEARSAIDAQLLLIQDRVSNGQMSFPDNFELLYDKNVLIFRYGRLMQQFRLHGWSGYYLRRQQ
jgi:hypothetical protein